MPLSFTDLVLIVGISQGFFLALAVQLLPNKNKIANKTLSLILIIAALALLGRVAGVRIKSNYLLKVGVLADATIYIFGPLLYCYIRRLTFNETPKYRLSWLHYSPILLNVIYFVWALSYSNSELMRMVNSGKLHSLFLIVELGGLISLTVYWYKSIRLFIRFKQIEKQELSYNQSIVRYLIFLLITLGLFIALWLFSFIGLYVFHFYSPYINYNVMWIIACLFIYVIGFFSLTQPEILRLPLTVKTKPKEKNRLSKVEIDHLKTKLNHLLINEQIFTTPDLSLKSLSEALETSSNNVSWLLNKIYKKTFYEYINEFRVEAFLKKIEAQEHQSQTLLAIALDVGFNSKSTFNKAFKTITNNTPSNYIKQMNTSV